MGEKEKEHPFCSRDQLLIQSTVQLRSTTETPMAELMGQSNSENLTEDTAYETLHRHEREYDSWYGCPHPNKDQSGFCRCQAEKGGSSEDCCNQYIGQYVEKDCATGLFFSFNIQVV